MSDSNHPYHGIKRVFADCYGNTCRSPQIKHFLLAALRDAGLDISVESAGVNIGARGKEVHEHSVECLKRHLEIDVAGEPSKWIGDLLDELPSVDLFIATGEDIKAALMTVFSVPENRIVVWDVPNPWMKDADAYDQTAEKVMRLAMEFVAALKAAA